jgi:hypothetical protein
MFFIYPHVTYLYLMLHACHTCLAPIFSLCSHVRTASASCISYMYIIWYIVCTSWCTYRIHACLHMCETHMYTTPHLMHISSLYPVPAARGQWARLPALLPTFDDAYECVYIWVYYILSSYILLCTLVHIWCASRICTHPHLWVCALFYIVCMIYAYLFEQYCVCAYVCICVPEHMLHMIHILYFMHRDVCLCAFTTCLYICVHTCVVCSLHVMYFCTVCVCVHIYVSVYVYVQCRLYMIYMFASLPVSHERRSSRFMRFTHRTTCICPHWHVSTHLLFAHDVRTFTYCSYSMMAMHCVSTCIDDIFMRRSVCILWRPNPWRVAMRPSMPCSVRRCILACSLYRVSCTS